MEEKNKDIVLEVQDAVLNPKTVELSLLRKIKELEDELKQKIKELEEIKNGKNNTR